MKKRSYQKEWIDLGAGHYTKEEYNDCLRQLERVGKWLGGDRATLRAFQELPKAPRSILDVGCGGGFLTRKLAERYPEAEVVGIDIDPLAIDYANQHSGPHPKNLRFEHRTAKELADPLNCYDVVTTTLVCHHMDDKTLTSFLKKATGVAREALILNDLHRHWLAWGSFALIAPLLFHNRLITHDGLLSIRRAFKKEDWINLLETSGIAPERTSLDWFFPFRWIVKVQCRS